MLIELPRNDMINNLQSVIFQLFCLGYVPIIAHPERYLNVQKDPNILLEYINQGVLFLGKFRKYMWVIW